MFISLPSSVFDICIIHVSCTSFVSLRKANFREGFMKNLDQGKLDQGDFSLTKANFPWFC